MDNEAMKKVIEDLLHLGNTVFSSVVPEEAKKHFRTAAKEVLLGMIDILDQAEAKQQKHASDGMQQEKPAARSIEITE